MNTQRRESLFHYSIPSPFNWLFENLEVTPPLLLFSPLLKRDENQHIEREKILTPGPPKPLLFCSTYRPCGVTLINIFHHYFSLIIYFNFMILKIKSK